MGLDDGSGEDGGMLCESQFNFFLPYVVSYESYGPWKEKKKTFKIKLIICFLILTNKKHFTEY